MPKYILKLGNGKSARITAKSPAKARMKYYSSASHFRTEAYVDSVRRIKNSRSSSRSSRKGASFKDLFRA